MFSGHTPKSTDSIAAKQNQYVSCSFPHKRKNGIQRKVDQPKNVGFFQAMEQGKSYRLVQRGGVVEAGALTIYEAFGEITFGYFWCSDFYGFFRDSSFC